MTLIDRLYELHEARGIANMLTDRILDLRSAAAVKRYHTVPTIGESQSVSTHSYGIAMILLRLWPLACTVRLLQAALEHDLPEGATGDIPAPAKWASPALVVALDELEAREHGRLGTGQAEADLDEMEVMMLRAADMLDLVFYCYEQRCMGNQMLAPVFYRGVGYLRTMAPLEKRIHAPVTAIISELEERYRSL